MVKQRHPDLAATMIHELEHGQHPSFTAVRECRGALVDRASGGPRTQCTQVWVAAEGHETTGRAQFFQDSVNMENPGRVFMRSQHAPLASAPLTALPTSRVLGRPTIPLPLVQATPFVSSFDPAHLPMWPPARLSWPPSSSGVLSWIVPSRRCAESGRVSPNVFVKDMDFAYFNVRWMAPRSGSGRFELSLWQGGQLAIDTTICVEMGRPGLKRPMRTALHSRSCPVNGGGPVGGARRRGWWEVF